jgi:hypothetical protein
LTYLDQHLLISEKPTPQQEEPPAEAPKGIHTQTMKRTFHRHYHHYPCVCNFLATKLISNFKKHPFSLIISLGPNKLIICERAKRTIACPAGSSITILSASYGRSGRSVCPGSVRTLRCSSKVALPRVKGRCDGRQSCELFASNSVYGDPCRGTVKYLDISYSCQGNYRSL